MKTKLAERVGNEAPPPPQSKLYRLAISKGVFNTLSNIYDGDFCDIVDS